MQARILQKYEEEKWEQFLQTQPLSTIHQSPLWGYFQEQIPSKGKYWIIGLFEQHSGSQPEKLIGGTMLILQKLPYMQSWLYAARGPLINYQSNAQEQMDLLIQAIKPLSKAENSIFLRIDPPIFELQPFPHFTGFKPDCHGFQPDHTLILDLKKSSEELLKEMKPKGRYNINLAQKKGVKIYTTHLHNQDNLERDVQKYFQLLEETTKRDGFHGHNKDFYKKMLEVLRQSSGNKISQQSGSKFTEPSGSKFARQSSANILNVSSNQPSSPSHCTQFTPSHHSLYRPAAALYLAKYNDEVLAGAIITYFKDTATYYYGVSSDRHRNLMAPYLLHWQVVQDARSSGFKYYDFFGIAPENEPNHPWQGVSQFKRKFGGQEISYHKPQEYPFKKSLYTIYHLYKKARSI